MMKVLKKMLAVAVSVATMAMSVSAFAATYDAKTNSVAMTAEELTADGKVPAAITGQMTVVVVPKNFGEDGTVTANNIYYINQEEFGTKFNEIIMKTVASDGTVISNGMGLCKPLADKDENGDDKKDKDGNLIINPKLYEVRIGGTNLKNEDGNYTVKFDITVEGGEVKFELGNVDGNYDEDGVTPKINTTDIVWVLDYVADPYNTVFPHPNGHEAGVKAANVDGNYEDDGITPKVNTTDIVWILDYVADPYNTVFPAAK